MIDNITHLFEERAPWTDEQCAKWATQQRVIKPYNDLLSRITNASNRLRNKRTRVNLTTYGKIDAYDETHNLTKVIIGDLNNSKPTIIITGCVHGYEPSGEDACIRFIEKDAHALSDQFNFIVYPYITPSAYVVDHRWNNFANDQNRSFITSLLTTSNAEIAQTNQEAVYFMQDIISMNKRFAASIDLHETPIRDIELRIARAERYGSKLSPDYQTLPDGSYFYIGSESIQQDENSNIIVPDFSRAIARSMGEHVPMAKDKIIIGSENHGNGIVVSKTQNTLRHFMSQYADISITTEICPESIIGDKKELAVKGQLATVQAVTQHLQMAA